MAQWQSGWDWFSLQFEDGRELMLFRLRTKAGRSEPENRYGILIERDGSSRVLNPAQIRLTPARPGAAPGQPYPIEWQLKAGDINLRIQARQPDQAMTGRFDYWEGAVSVSGMPRGRLSGDDRLLSLAQFPSNGRPTRHQKPRPGRGNNAVLGRDIKTGSGLLVAHHHQAMLFGEAHHQGRLASVRHLECGDVGHCPLFGLGQTQHPLVLKRAEIA